MIVRVSIALGIVLAMFALSAPAYAQDGVQRLHYEFGPIQIAPRLRNVAMGRAVYRAALAFWEGVVEDPAGPS